LQSDLEITIVIDTKISQTLFIEKSQKTFFSLKKFVYFKNKQYLCKVIENNESHSVFEQAVTLVL